MIAAFITEKVARSGAHPNFNRTEHHIHVVAWVGRSGLKVKLLAYCEAQGDASRGVIQVPESVFVPGNTSALAVIARLRKVTGIEISPVACPVCGACAGLTPA